MKMTTTNRSRRRKSLLVHLYGQTESSGCVSCMVVDLVDVIMTVMMIIHHLMYQSLMKHYLWKE